MFRGHGSAREPAPPAQYALGVQVAQVCAPCGRNMPLAHTSHAPDGVSPRPASHTQAVCDTRTAPAGHMMRALRLRVLACPIGSVSVLCSSCTRKTESCAAFSRSSAILTAVSAALFGEEVCMYANSTLLSTARCIGCMPAARTSCMSSSSMPSRQGRPSAGSTGVFNVSLKYPLVSSTKCTFSQAVYALRENASSRLSRIAALLPLGARALRVAFSVPRRTSTPGPTTILATSSCASRMKGKVACAPDTSSASLTTRTSTSARTVQLASGAHAFSASARVRAVVVRAYTYLGAQASPEEHASHVEDGDSRAPSVSRGHTHCSTSCAPALLSPSLGQACCSQTPVCAHGQ